MKKIILLSCICLAIGTVNAQQIPKVKIDALVKMIDTSTTPMVINFWASWCAPCIREIPWFEKTVAKYRDQKVTLVLVSLDFADDYPKGIADFVKKNGYTSRIIWLDESNADAFCAKIDASWDGAIPVTLMVNNKKHYRKFFAQQLPEPKLVQELELLIAR